MLIAGKGHEDYQSSAPTGCTSTDREQAAAALAGRGGKEAAMPVFDAAFVIQATGARAQGVCPTCPSSGEHRHPQPEAGRALRGPARAQLRRS